MSFDTLTNRAASIGNGVTTAFSFPYLVFKADDLLVLLVDTLGVPVVQVLDVDYTVTGLNVDTGGTVTMVVPPPLNFTLVILRNPDTVQETDIKNQGPFKAITHEKAFDLSRMISQKLEELIGRSLKLPVQEAGSPLLVELPPLTQRLGLILGFDPSTGAPVARANGPAPGEILWTVRDFIALTDNPFPRYTAQKDITFARFDITAIGLGVGGNTVLNIVKNAGVITTVTLPAGQKFATTSFAIPLVSGDETYPEWSSIAPTTPPQNVTIAFRTT
jgi:hypothetical protein